MGDARCTGQAVVTLKEDNAALSPSIVLQGTLKTSCFPARLPKSSISRVVLHFRAGFCTGDHKHHGMVWVERDFQAHSVPAPCHR